MTQSASPCIAKTQSSDTFLTSKVRVLEVVTHGIRGLIGGVPPKVLLAQYLLLLMPFYRFLDDSDYGWSVSSSIGLHHFAWTDYYSVGAYDFSRRVAWDNFELHYHREQYVKREFGMLPFQATVANRTMSNGLPPSDSGTY